MKIEEKKGWSWLGFFFAPYYYAGYNKLKKGLILAIISGLIPLGSLVVNIYGGLNAKKELPIGNQKFNWKNVSITLVVLVIVSLIPVILIEIMKG